MLTVIIKRNAEPNVIQLTQENIMKELGQINGSEMLLEDNWNAGLRKVRTPFVSLMEADCILGPSYISSNLGLMRKTAGKGNYRGGGYTKLAMLSSCLGVRNFANRIYGYRTDGREILPDRVKVSSSPYHVQVGFLAGAILRYASIKELDLIDSLYWDEPNLVKLSTEVSFALWKTNRRIQINPTTTYVSEASKLELPYPLRIPKKVTDIFIKEGI